MTYSARLESTGSFLSRVWVIGCTGTAEAGGRQEVEMEIQTGDPKPPS